MTTAAALPRATPIVASRGHCRPYGATPNESGVNFAVFSRHAHQVYLALFKEGHDEPFAEFPLDPVQNKTGDVWHIFVHDLEPDVLYGYRVDGPMQPRSGHRFNLRRIVLDPYARAIHGGDRWGIRKMAYSGTGALARRGRTVVDDFDWEDDAPPKTPMSETILYELHVRGYTRHASSGVRYPGTYLGLCEKIPHLQALGVTAIQLMPVLEFDELDHANRNPDTGELLRNYWGYAPLSFFALKASYAAHAGQEIREFKEMVKTFHRAGIEVILDIVYNHTSEGNQSGPTFSFRGLDNAIYYMLDQDGHYYNFTGCGNTVNCNHPVVRDLIIDSLTYLVSELHVDGFRFDLATILTRGADGKVLDNPPLIEHIAAHPVLAGTKLIAEAWDASGLSQLGKFPVWGRWSELNGWFRDDVRRFVRGDAAAASLAKRICGSLDLYGDSAHNPYHSVNFITCHDGYTLSDLVSYNHKHNHTNGEQNYDGWEHNFSWNCGQEGPTDDPHIHVLRQRQIKNFLTLLMISQGVPFLSQGDEFGRTQQGNNNAYCQDNEISWVDWTLAQTNASLVRFTRMLIALRKKHFALNREQFINHVSWHGRKIGNPDWTGQQRVLAFQLHGMPGKPSFFLLFNAHAEYQKILLPPHDGQWRWQRLLDTNLPCPADIAEEADAVTLNPADHYVAAPFSAVILIAPS